MTMLISSDFFNVLSDAGIPTRERFCQTIYAIEFRYSVRRINFVTLSGDLRTTENCPTLLRG